MSMKKYTIKIKGLRPLLWNTMKKELEDEKKALKKNEMDEWECDPKNWLRKACIIQKGKYPKPAENVLVPHTWLKAMIVDACKHSRIVPHFATRKNETYTRYAESLIVESEKPICKVKNLKEHGAFLGAQGKNSSTKVWKIRPELTKWQHEFILVDPFGRMTKKELKEILDYAGIIEGIGDGRSVNMGRFELVTIKELKK